MEAERIIWMKRLGIFMDVSNLYYCIHKKFDGRKLDYDKFKAFVEDLGDIQQAIAYGAQLRDEANGFVHCLQQIGFTTKWKIAKTYGSNKNEDFKRKADHDVTIAIDIVNMINSIDRIILGSADGDLVPVVEWAQQRGVDVVVLACGISRDLKAVATKAIEIPESLLEVRDDTQD